MSINALTTTGGPLTMSSREIADLTGKSHDNVLRDIRKMLAELKEDVLKFEATYFDKQNRQQTEYHLDRELTDTLLTGYSAVARRTVIARWHKLEADTVNPRPPEQLTRMDILRIAMESEEARIKAEAERDEAVRTKAQIGSKREATAMATASAAKREVAQLRDQLGFNTRHATVLAVDDITGKDYDWVPLRRWCKANEVTPETVPDKRYPRGVKAWPAAAWLEVYGVDLVELFGEVMA